jgi:hypothetical protein
VLTGNANFLKPLELEDFQAVKVLRNEDSDLQKMTSFYQFYFSKRQKSLTDNNFLSFKTIESAGTVLTAVASTNQKKNSNGNYEIFNLEYSEYIKTEFDYIKHWDLSKEKIVAFRSFFWHSNPFNSDYVPFSRSYFQVDQDNRAWQPYGLGPGSSGALDDFNEANMKIAISAEFDLRY